MTKKLLDYGSKILPTLEQRFSLPPTCFSYDEVFRHYFNISGTFLKLRNRALKTDCYNESISRPIVGDGSIKMIEFQQKTINEALRKNPTLNIIQGDIRHLPFKDGEFNLILDLSTLDHIMPSEVPATLKGYYRVLEKNGILVLITWVSKVQPESPEWNPDNQYYFSYEMIAQALRQLFQIKEETLLFKRDDQKAGMIYLYEFICLK